MHWPEMQTGVVPEHTAHPAGEPAVPQWAASDREHDWQVFAEVQYLPVPHSLSWAHATHTPTQQSGVVPEQAAHPAAEADVPQ